MTVGSPVYIIAEAGVNHDGNIDDAFRLVDAAADAGADCVKFQTFKADALAAHNAEKAAYQKRATGGHESQADMLRRLELPRDAHAGLFLRAKERGIGFLSTPFDIGSLQFLIGEMGLDQIKIGSGDLTNAPLLLEAARSDVRVILSTGMATLDDVAEAIGILAVGYLKKTPVPCREDLKKLLSTNEALDVLRRRGSILHCTTEYPTPASSVNLRAMDALRDAFGLPTGYSDHTLGINVAVAAVARGATILEKHLTLDCSREGPDHEASLNPTQFKEMVDAVRAIEEALGDGVKRPQPAEIPNMAIARKSIVASRAIKKGETFSEGNLTCKRPGGGLSPFLFWDIQGRVATRDFAPDQAIEL